MSEKLVSIISGTKSVTINLTVLITSIAATIKNEAKKLRERDQLIDAQISGNEETLTEDVWNTIKNAVIASIKDEFKAFPVIAGKTLEAHISQNTDYTNRCTVYKHFINSSHQSKFR